MRADLWRYATLYARGGLYADVDVQALRPVAQWLPPQDKEVKGMPYQRQYMQYSWDGCAMVIGLENDVHFCQWVSVPLPGGQGLQHQQQHEQGTYSWRHVSAPMLEDIMHCCGGLAY